MFTLFNFKIQTAAIISLAFIFRVLFISIPLLPSFNNSQTHKLLTEHFSTTQKKRRQLASAAQSSAITTQYGVTKYEGEEIYEENLAAKKALIKANSLILLFFLLALLKSIVTPSRTRAFSSIKYYLYPKKYLAFSNLRI